jgi:hypothetical protein
MNRLLESGYTSKRSNTKVDVSCMDRLAHPKEIYNTLSVNSDVESALNKDKPLQKIVDIIIFYTILKNSFFALEFFCKVRMSFFGILLYHLYSGGNTTLCRLMAKIHIKSLECIIVMIYLQDFKFFLHKILNLKYNKPSLSLGLRYGNYFPAFSR